MLNAVVDFVADIPVEPKYVRAELHSSGFVIVPFQGPEGQQWSEVTNIANVDLGGSIPSSIVNMVMKKQPLIVHKIRAFVET